MDAITKDRTLKTADLYAQQGKFDAAIAEYRKVSLADPDDLTVANTLGDLYLRQGRQGEAIKHFTRVADRFTSSGYFVKAIAMYKKIAKLEPNNIDLQLRMGELYAKQNLMGEARQQYALAAETMKRNGQPKDALKILKKIADLDPTNIKTRIALAQSFAAEGYRNEASEAFRAAGQECMRRGGAEEAAVNFKKALDLRPDSRPALKALAEAHAQMGDVQQALDVIVRALEVDPNDVDLIIILGRTFLNAGMLEKAETTFERLFKLDNARYDYLLEVGRGYIERGEHDRAMLIVDRCIDLLLARRQKKKATAMLKAILERDPENVGALKRLAGIYKSVRERRNLINTLNTLVQVALARDMRAEAANALRQLIEMEPKKQHWQKQLASLGALVQEIRTDEAKAVAVWAEAIEQPGHEANDIYDSYGDYSTELLEEMVSQHPEFLAARLKLLEDLVAQQPAYIEGRLKLKQLYLDGGQKGKAAAQCLDIARQYEQQGDKEVARQYLLEAFALNPELKRPSGTGDLAGKAAAAAAAAPDPDPVARGVKLSDLLGVEEFEEHFERVWQLAAGEPRPVSLIKIVVDRFKSFEEHEGPIKSLSCLERIAGALSNEMQKDGQLLASLGDDEFFALLPETHPGTVASTADAMRKGVEGLAIPHPLASKVTVSLGVATAFPYRGHDPEQVIESINTAVTKAQANGGNRIVTVPLLES
jgi:diguanylate cyclase (GGDEF)-like protein